MHHVNREYFKSSVLFTFGEEAIYTFKFFVFNCNPISLVNCERCLILLVSYLGCPKDRPVIASE